MTLIERCSEDKLKIREDWYLQRFKPLLNYLTFSYRDPRILKGVSPITKKKNKYVFER
jgi:hypothetical protein